MTTTTNYTATVRTACDQQALVLVMEGLTLGSLATECCGAAATYVANPAGGDDVPACKDCYRQVPETFILPLPEALAEVGCPIPFDCAMHTQAQAEADAEAYAAH